MTKGSFLWALALLVVLCGGCASNPEDQSDDKMSMEETAEVGIPDVVARTRGLEAEARKIAKKRAWAMPIVEQNGTTVERAWMSGSHLIAEAWNPVSRRYEIYYIDAAAGQQRWLLQLGSNRLLRPPHVGHGTIAFLTEKDAGMTVVDSKYGSRLWTYAARVRAIPSTDAISNGDSVYFGDEVSERFVSSSAADGRLGWDFVTGSRVTAAPALTHGLPRDFLVVAATSGDVWGLDAKSWTEVAPDVSSGWHQRLRGRVSSDPTYAIIRDEEGNAAAHMVFVACEDKFLYGIDARSGRLKWSLPTDAPFVDSKPHVAGGKVFVRNERRLLCVDALTGQRAWWPAGAEGLSDYDKTQTFGRPEGFETAERLLGSSGEHVYLKWGDSTVLRCNAETGAIEGSEKLDAFDFFLTNPATGTLICGTRDGFFVSFE